MIEVMLGSGLGLAILAGLVGYGRLQQKVDDQGDDQKEKFDLLRADISRLDQRVADLTDFLLREYHGETADQVLKR